MIQEILFTAMAVITHGMVDASQVCLSKGKQYACTQPPPAFIVKPPSFCLRCVCYSKPLLITGCSIPIICVVVALVLCLANKTRCKPPQLIFINMCLAHLGMYVFFLVSALTFGIIAIGLFVDLFLLVFVCSVLVEAIDIWLNVHHKSIPHDLVIVVVCCWVLPVLKCIIIFAANPKAYHYDCGDYFLARGRAVAIADITIITLIFLATVGFIASSIWTLCPASGKEKEDERKEIWDRIVHLALMCLFFYTWVFTLLGIGIICILSFGVVFIIFGSGHGIAILVGFICRHVRKKEFRKQFTVDPFCWRDSTE